jgi:hypothetical protein
MFGQPNEVGVANLALAGRTGLLWCEGRPHTSGAACKALVAPTVSCKERTHARPKPARLPAGREPVKGGKRKAPDTDCLFVQPRPPTHTARRHKPQSPTSIARHLSCLRWDSNPQHVPHTTTSTPPQPHAPELLTDQHYHPAHRPYVVRTGQSGCSAAVNNAVTPC